jgi:hypothetical protein
MADAPAPRAPDPVAPAEGAPVAPQADLASDETPLRPEIAAGVNVAHLDPAVPWAAEVGASPGAARHEAALAARVQLFYDDTASDVAHSEEWEAIFFPLGEAFDPAAAMQVDHDPRDFRPAAHPGAAYVLPEAGLEAKSYFRSAETAIKNHLYQNLRVTILKNPALKLYSRVGESKEAFLQRCDREAERRADEDAAKLRGKYAAKLKRVEAGMAAAERRIDELEVDIQGKRDSQLMDTAGTLLGVLLGRRSTRSVTGSARSRASIRSAEQRLATAVGKASDLSRDYAELERELRLELEEINDRWEDAAMEIEEFEIGLEKNDISVNDLSVVWIPVAR